MDLFLKQKKDEIGEIIYMVFDGDKWRASFANKEDAEDFIEMLKAREEDRQSFSPQP